MTLLSGPRSLTVRGYAGDRLITAGPRAESRVRHPSFGAEGTLGACARTIRRRATRVRLKP